MKRAAKILSLLLATLIIPAGTGGAGLVQDGAPPRLLEWPMLPGESITQLAGLIYPGDPAMQRRFITAALRENPATFSDMSARQPFAQETLIWLPDLKALSQVASRSPRHYLRPVLPAMQPSVDGAQPSRLQMSSAIVDQQPAGIEISTPPAAGVALAAAPAIRHKNAMPAYDQEASLEIEALMARNETLKQQQQALDERIAQLEAGISQVRDAIARDRRRQPRRIKQIKTREPAVTTSLPDALLSPSPVHLLTLTALLLTGGGVVWLRRRRASSLVKEESVVVVAPSMAASSQKSGTSKEAAIDFGAPASQIQIEENFTDDGFISVDEIASIVEEAKVFVALGRTDHATEILEDYITTHPRASAHPWLYLMDIHRSLQRRDDFESVARRFHEALNVITPLWENSGQNMMVVPRSLEEFPHILAKLAEGWGSKDAQEFLNHLLQDNRGGERQGFSMEVLQEILLLSAILELRDHLPKLESF